jgi:hypothetical protein
MQEATTGRLTNQKYNAPLDLLIDLAVEHTGREPSSLPNLHDYIDGDLVNQFLRHPPVVGELRFKWDSMVVTITADQHIRIRSFGGPAGAKRAPWHKDPLTKYRHTNMRGGNSDDKND